MLDFGWGENPRGAPRPPEGRSAAPPYRRRRPRFSSSKMASISSGSGSSTRPEGRPLSVFRCRPRRCRPMPALPSASRTGRRYVVQGTASRRLREIRLPHDSQTRYSPASILASARVYRVDFPRLLLVERGGHVRRGLSFWDVSSNSTSGSSSSRLVSSFLRWLLENRSRAF